MKNVLISMLLALTTVNGFAQKPSRKADSLALKLFNEGLDAADAGKNDDALAKWTKIVDQKMGMQNNVYGTAFFNVASIYWKMGNRAEAKAWYKNLIASNLKDSDPSLDISEPHANYKHKSAVALASLYSIDGNFPEALNWILAADTLYRYWGFDGSESSIADEENTVLSQETDILLRLKRRDEAVHALLLQLICSGTTESSFQDAEPKLLRLVDHKAFLAALDKAIAAATIERKSTGSWLVKFDIGGSHYAVPCTTTIPDKKLPTYHKTLYLEKGTELNKQFFGDYIRNRSFYRALAG